MTGLQALGAAALALVLAACAASPGPAASPDPAVPPATARATPDAIPAGTMAELERTFWYCDCVATRRGAQAAPIAACRLVWSELKRRKFEGDFEALLAWWRERKEFEHGRERCGAPAPGSLT